METKVFLFLDVIEDLRDSVVMGSSEVVVGFEVVLVEEVVVPVLRLILFLRRANILGIFVVATIELEASVLIDFVLFLLCDIGIRVND